MSNSLLLQRQWDNVTLKPTTVTGTPDLGINPGLGNNYGRWAISRLESGLIAQSLSFIQISHRRTDEPR